jgi:hypothetical protein
MVTVHFLTAGIEGSIDLMVGGKIEFSLLIHYNDFIFHSSAEPPGDGVIVNPEDDAESFAESQGELVVVIRNLFSSQRDRSFNDFIDRPGGVFYNMTIFSECLSRQDQGKG